MRRPSLLWRLMQMERGRRTAAAVAVGTSWNPADKHVDIALSNGNLTATNTVNAYRGVRAIASASSGKKYWEVTAGTAADVAQNVAGVAESGQTLADFLGSGNGYGLTGGGSVLSGGAVVTTIQTWVQGDTICIALDIDAGKIWFRTNGGNWNNSGAADPAANTGGLNPIIGGPYFPAVSLHATNDAFTANFGGSSFAQTPPNGFGNW